jgi:predicted nucleic acid-binding protein
VALVVLDARVVIAFRDPHDALYARAIAAFRTHRAAEFVLPASVYAEVLVGPLRHGAAVTTSLDTFIHDFGMRIVPLDVEIARGAALLRAQTPALRLPDAFVLATGEVLDADAVLTCDVAWPKLSRRAKLI